MTRRPGIAARWRAHWRALEDRWLGPLAAREAKLMGTWRAGVRYVPTPSLRWTLRGALLLVALLSLGFVLPVGWWKALLLALFFGVTLGGLWAASRDLR
jgi:hypothetical protein